MSIATKSISSYLPIRARTNRTRDQSGFESSISLERVSHHGHFPKPGRCTRRVRRVHLDVDDRIGHLPLFPFTLVFFASLPHGHCFCQGLGANLLWEAQDSLLDLVCTRARSGVQTAVNASFNRNTCPV